MTGRRRGCPVYVSPDILCADAMRRKKLPPNERTSTMRINYKNNDHERTQKFWYHLRRLAENTPVGEYDKTTRQHVPETGRRWVQVQRLRVDGIDGYAFVDAFNSINQRFRKLTSREVVTSIINGKGFFATADPLSRLEFDPVFLTHHVTTFETLDRLRSDLAKMFDLVAVLTWKEEEVECTAQPNCRDDALIEVECNALPNCWVDSLISDAIDNDYGLLAVRIGTEKDFRRVAEHGITLNRDNTHMYGEYPKTDPRVKNLVLDGVRELCKEWFDSGTWWGSDVSAKAKVMPDIPVENRIPAHAEA